MPSPAAAPSPKPSRTIAADFPVGFFLENFLAVRHDNSLLIAVANRKELYYVPPPRPNGKVEPTSLHIFRRAGRRRRGARNPTCFVVQSGNVYTTHDNYACTDLTSEHASPGRAGRARRIPAFPPAVAGPQRLRRPLALHHARRRHLRRGDLAGRLFCGPAQASRRDSRLKDESMAICPTRYPPPPRARDQWPALLPSRRTTSTTLRPAKSSSCAWQSTRSASNRRACPSGSAAGALYPRLSASNEPRGVAYLTVCISRESD